MDCSCAQTIVGLFPFSRLMRSMPQIAAPSYVLPVELNMSKVIE